MRSKPPLNKRVLIRLNNKKGQVVNGFNHNRKPLVHLRTFTKNCSEADVNSMIKKYNIFDCGRNEKGFFDNTFQPETISNDKVLISNLTGLMWHQSGSIEPMEWCKGEEWLSELNGDGYAGYLDWRLPTIEEAASLLKVRENNMDLFIDPYFSNQQENIWTCDSYGMYLAWKVDLLMDMYTCNTLRAVSTSALYAHVNNKFLLLFPYLNRSVTICLN